MNDSVAVLSIVQIVVVGTPILLAAVGETLTQRSGVMNLGIEGMMLFGAVLTFWATNETGSVWIGLWQVQLQVQSWLSCTLCWR